jgi:hypothetical protein
MLWISLYRLVFRRGQQFEIVVEAGGEGLLYGRAGERDFRKFNTDYIIDETVVCDTDDGAKLDSNVVGVDGGFGGIVGSPGIALQLHQPRKC